MVYDSDFCLRGFLGLKRNLLCLLITGVAVGLMQGAISFYAVTSMSKFFQAFLQRKMFQDFV